MKSKKHFFDASIAPEELEKILQTIDENIAARTELRQAPAVSNAEVVNSPQGYILPVPAPMPDFFASIALIRNAQAPYYVVDGSLPARVIKKIFNLFIKAFGRKQAYYNNLTLDVINALVVHINILQQQNVSQVNLINDLVGTIAQLENSVEELYTAQAGNRKFATPPIKTLKQKTVPKRKKITVGRH